MKRKYLFLLTALISSHYSIAANISEPKACPSVEAIKAVGISNVEDILFAWAAEIPNTKFGTSDNWSFTMMFGKENLPVDVDPKEKANELLSRLKKSQGPVLDFDGGNVWKCLYFGPDEITLAVATKLP